MQKFIMICLTLAAATMLSIGYFYSSASASDSSLIEMQKSTKTISKHIVDTGENLPSAFYYYSAGGYHGWLSLQSSGGTKGKYYGVYAGTVYPQGIPVPVPFDLPVEEK